jgi:hypothetical protein
MALWRLTINIEDEKQATARKVYYGNFADYATASAKRSALITDFDAATTAGIQTHELAEVVVVGASAGAGSNVFEQVNATIQLNDLKKANFKLPSPIGTLFTGNALKIDDTAWTNLMANFASGEWELSDTDHYVSTVKGARSFSSSGKTNIPV